VGIPVGPIGEPIEFVVGDDVLVEHGLTRSQNYSAEIGVNRW
jgi:hypothetical protein